MELLICHEDRFEEYEIRKLWNRKPSQSFTKMSNGNAEQLRLAGPHNGQTDLCGLRATMNGVVFE
jgi:hypothetical protein